MKRTVALALLLLTSCAAASEPPKVATVGSGAEPLRAEFDAAAGKVRAILLASPT
jgi:hypothetical protein